MVKGKFWVTLVILAAFATTVFTGCDSPTGNDNDRPGHNQPGGPGNGNHPGGPGNGQSGNGQPVTFTVTFNSAGGSAVASQNVADGGLVQVPVATRTWVAATAGLWVGSGLPTAAYTLVEWRHEGEAWNFATDTVTGNMTLTAQWNPPAQVSTPIAGVDPHDLEEVMDFVNDPSNSGAFTLAIGEELITTGNHRLRNFDGVELTIVGVGGRQDIVLNADCDECLLFSVGYFEAPAEGSESSLILGNNITLRGGQGADVVAPSIVVSRTGHLIMEAGSEITGHINDGTDSWSGHGATVHIGADAAFTMRGGTITGNRASGTGTNLAGGVFVQHASSVFTMTGGSISGNFRGTGSDEVPADVFVAATVEDFTVSGNAEIGRLILDSIPPAAGNDWVAINPLITLGTGWNGNVHNLDLRSDVTSPSGLAWQWIDSNPVLQAASNQTLTTASMGRVGSTSIRFIGRTETVTQDVTGAVGFFMEDDAAILLIRTIGDGSTGRVVITIDDFDAGWLDVAGQPFWLTLRSGSWPDIVNHARGIAYAQDDRLTFYMYVMDGDSITDVPFASAGKFFMSLVCQSFGGGTIGRVNITQGNQTMLDRSVFWSD